MKILISSAFFKGSLSATHAAAAIERGLRRSGLDAELVSLPVADGGDGTLDAFLAGGGKRVTISARDPLNRPIQADFGMLGDGTAVIEMALASGVALLHPREFDPLRASTYGTGELMRAALERGARRMIVGMGGSATVDGGTGCLSALGVRFLDAKGRIVLPCGGNLRRIQSIDVTGLDPRWRDVDVIIASDVDNLTLGERGAAVVFAPQKGASPDEVRLLENNLTHFFTVVSEQLGIDVRATPGGGAAGAFAAGLMAFLGGRIESGIDLILAVRGFEDQLADADLVITSEGRIDTQTIGGKGPIGVARRARERGVPTVAIVGGLDADDGLLHDAGMWAVVPITPKPMSLDEAIDDAETLVERAALRLGYLLQIPRRH